jgi:hypothetical protein
MLVDGFESCSVLGNQGQIQKKTETYLIKEMEMEHKVNVFFIVFE